MDQRYVKAASVLRTILIENPENREALFLSSAIRQTEILDYESYNVDGERFCRYAENTLRDFAHALPSQKGKDSLDCLFYLAATLGEIGVIQAKNGNWPSAIKKALSSVKHLKRLVMLDSTYYPGYYGIGVFNYYLSQNFKWLPFFGDNRPEAIEQLKKATQSAFPYNYGVHNSLGWILLERNELRQADSIVSEVLSKYPDNTMFIRIKIRIELGNLQWNSVMSRACRLIELSLKRDPVNWPDIISGYQALVCCYDNLNKGCEAFDTASRVLALPVPDHIRKISFVKKHLKYITDIRKKYNGR